MGNFTLSSDAGRRAGGGPLSRRKGELREADIPQFRIRSSEYAVQNKSLELTL
jgi:hypothetical protein